MIIRRVEVGAYATNCYLVEQNGTKVLIDPGDADGQVLPFLEKQGFIPEAVLVTHGHLDHYGDVPSICAAYDLPVWFPRDEVSYLAESDVQGGPWNADKRDAFLKVLETNGRLVDHGDEIRIGEICFEARMIEHHTRAGMCLYNAENQVLFSGDNLFRGSIGRTDLYKGDTKGLCDGIRRQLLTLPDDTKVYPGHGDATTIGVERRSNYYLTHDPEALW